MTDKDEIGYLEMTVTIVTSFVANNKIEPSDLPDVIRAIHATVLELANADTPLDEPLEPAVPIAKSVTSEYLVCLEDGRKLKMMKRYLRTRYDMTPEEYRARWRLPADYPMVAPNYAKLRSRHAKQIGLGKKR